MPPILTFCPGSKAGMPVESLEAVSSSAFRDRREGELTQVRAAAAPERVAEVAVSATARDAALDLSRRLLARLGGTVGRARVARRRIRLRGKARLDEVVLLLLVEQDLAHAARAVLACPPGPLDVAIGSLDQRWSLEVLLGQQGRFVNGRGRSAGRGCRGRRRESPERGLGCP